MCCVQTKLYAGKSLPAFHFFLCGHGDTQPCGMTAVPHAHATGHSMIRPLTNPAAESAAAPPFSGLQQHWQQCPHAPCKEAGAKTLSFFHAVCLCPALGACSSPQLAERKQEVEEKNRHSRVQRWQPSTHLPSAPVLHCPRRGEGKGSRAFAGLSQSSAAYWQGGRRQRNSDPVPHPSRSAPWGSTASPERTSEQPCRTHG